MNMQMSEPGCLLRGEGGKMPRNCRASLESRASLKKLMSGGGGGGGGGGDDSDTFFFLTSILFLFQIIIME